MLKRMFLSTVHDLPGRVVTSGFSNGNSREFACKWMWKNEYHWLEMSLQRDKRYTIRGHYPDTRGLPRSETIARNISLKDGLRLLRGFQDAGMDGYFSESFGGTLHPTLSTPATHHINETGPRYGVHGRQPARVVDAMVLAQIRRHRAGTRMPRRHHGFGGAA